jgi:hypothetical protein
MTEYGAVVLLSLVCFFGCICIGFVLAAASLVANSDD